MATDPTYDGRDHFGLIREPINVVLTSLKHRVDNKWKMIRATYKILIVGYNHSFRYIMKYRRNCSASGMFVFNSIPSFMELWRNYIYGFMQRLNNSDNTIVAATVSSCWLSSAMWRRWESILYTKTSCLQYLSCYFLSVIFTVLVTAIWVCIMYLYLINV